MNWLTFFVGVLVGWLIELIIDFVFWRRRYQGSATAARLRIEVAGLEAQNSQLESELTDCQAGRTQSSAYAAELQARTAELEQANARVASLEAARVEMEAEFAQRAAAINIAVGPDDLRKIEGIGPKIASILGDAGIETFAQLAQTEVARLREILQAAGSRYALANPETWPEQARLAAAGDWKAMEALQDELQGGRRRRHQPL